MIKARTKVKITKCFICGRLVSSIHQRDFRTVLDPYSKKVLRCSFICDACCRSKNCDICQEQWNDIEGGLCKT